tara:strand:+ start:93 stop:830 length:738 start_codon:yes stop_codon:yes gene_type:complete
LREWYENHYQQGGEVLLYDYYEYFKSNWKDSTINVKTQGQSVPCGYQLKDSIKNLLRLNLTEITEFYNSVVHEKKWWNYLDNLPREKKTLYHDTTFALHILFFMYKKHNILVPPTVLCNGCEILPVHGQGRIYNLVAFSKTANVLYVKFSQDIYPNCFYRTIKSAADLWNVITEKVINNYKIKISINHMDRLMENWNNTKGRTLFWPILQGFHRNFENNYQLKAIEIWKACQENPIRLGETIIYL